MASVAYTAKLIGLFHWREKWYCITANLFSMWLALSHYLEVYSIAAVFIFNHLVFAVPASCHWRNAFCGYIKWDDVLFFNFPLRIFEPFASKSQREVKWSRDFEVSGLIADHLWSIRCWFNWRREKYYYYYYSYLNVADVRTSSHSSNRSFGVEFCHLLSKLKRWQHRWWRWRVFLCLLYNGLVHFH